MTRRRARHPAAHDDAGPVHLVLDNEALARIERGRPSEPVVVALLGAVASGATVVLPASVIVERHFDRRSPASARANALLRDVDVDALAADRAAEAVGLRLRSSDRSSVVDAHVATAALAVVRRHGGRAMVATSDPDDLVRLLDAAADASLRTAVGVQVLR